MSAPPISPADLGGCTPDEYQAVLAAVKGDSSAALALCQVFATRSRADDVAFGLNTGFLLMAGALVFIMHGGFAMLEAGAIRSKNAMNILLQTVLDGAASAIMWYLVGWGFAYGIGDNPNGFIGDAMFAMSRYKSHVTVTGTGNWTAFFFQWAFCATAATIPAGAVAERFNFTAYLGYSLFLGGFVYPVVAHWVWSAPGWLGYGRAAQYGGALFGSGMIDFAGSGVVHMTGGLAGLTGAVLVGPRLGRFGMDGRPVPMPGHSAILVVLGTVLLWFGWYGFNPGSALTLDTRAAATIAGRAAVTTTLSGAAGGLTCLLLGWARSVAWDLISLCNGMLCGFVAVTAGCHVLEPWAALLVGGGGALLFEAGCAALLRLRVDDVVSAGPMHGFCGAWGVLFVGLLAKQEYVQEAYVRDSYPYGLFYGGGGRLLASQVIGVLAIAGWVVGLMAPFFLAFRLAGRLRISAEDENIGLDVSKHGGSAYHMPHFPHAYAFAHAHGGHGGGGGGGGGGDGGGRGGAGDAVMRGATIGFPHHAHGGGSSLAHSLHMPYSVSGGNSVYGSPGPSMHPGGGLRGSGAAGAAANGNGNYAGNGNGNGNAVGNGGASADATSHSMAGTHWQSHAPQQQQHLQQHLHLQQQSAPGRSAGVTVELAAAESGRDKGEGGAGGGGGEGGGGAARDAAAPPPPLAAGAEEGAEL